MKRFSISTQLLLIVMSILLITSCLFVVITYFSLNQIALSQVENRLRSSLGDFGSEGPQRSFDDMKIYSIQSNNGNLEYSYNGKIISQTEFEEEICTLDEIEDVIITSSLEFSRPDKSNLKLYVNNKGKKIYYLILSSPQGYKLVLTDEGFSKTFISSILVPIFSLFLVIIFISVSIIYAWSTRVTRRLKMIQNHILNLPKNKYQEVYEDDAFDEIGSLSKSVEKMRIEIGTNEHTKQDMLQNISHDFKTPIAVIKSYAEAYQDGVAGAEALDVIIEQSELLKKKVNRLLQYNSLEYLTKDKPFIDVSMNELIERVVANNKFQTSILFTLDLEPSTFFLGYEENWSTVVENIIDNAKRYAKSEIKIILRNNSLRIYNDGEAIDEQFLNSVFKPYEKGSKGQFGLGMSIVKKTVDFFGMNMRVVNEEYGGVSFIIENRE